MNHNWWCAVWASDTNAISHTNIVRDINFWALLITTLFTCAKLPNHSISIGYWEIDEIFRLFNWVDDHLPNLNMSIFNFITIHWHKFIW